MNQRNAHGDNAQLKRYDSLMSTNRDSANESSESLAERILRLEELVSHQQHLLEQLDTVAANLQQQLDKHRHDYKSELDRLRYQMSNQDGDDLPHEKPPHY